MRPTSWLVTVAALAGLLALPLTASGTATSVSPHAVVKAAYNKQLKQTILVDTRGLTLYMWTEDRRFGSATCYDDPNYHCSKAWPPLRTRGAPKAGPGVKASLLGVAERTDGASQVTYRGYPLYTNAGRGTLEPDRRPGDINGLGFLGMWWAVSPSGRLVKG